MAAELHLETLRIDGTELLDALVTSVFLLDHDLTVSYLNAAAQTLLGLGLFLTYFIMQPVGVAVHTAAIVPFEQGKLNTLQALDLASAPVRRFMLSYAREKDLALFVELSKEPRPKTPQDLSMRVIVPAYIISELKAGFQIGAVLFLPFLVIDMAVASITTAVGMMQLPPVVISTPLKLLVFVMADGWNLLVGSIMKSFY